MLFQNTTYHGNNILTLKCSGHCHVKLCLKMHVFNSSRYEITEPLRLLQNMLVHTKLTQTHTDVTTGDTQSDVWLSAETLSV